MLLVESLHMRHEGLVTCCGLWFRVEGADSQPQPSTQAVSPQPVKQLLIHPSPNSWFRVSVVQNDIQLYELQRSVR